MFCKEKKGLWIDRELISKITKRFRIMTMYKRNIMHVYKQGYSVLPGLTKFTGAPFVKNEKLLAERQKATKTQKVFFEHEIDDTIYEPICRYIASESNQAYQSFPRLALNLSEDVIIHRIKDHKDWMAAGHICLPSGWNPEEKIGKPLEEIHKPVPGMRNNHFKLVEAMIHSGPFLRYVWSVVFDDSVNHHPSIPQKRFNPITNSDIYVKVEEQMTIGFPEIQAALFVLRQNILKPDEIDYASLYKACNSMNDEQKKYKGVSDELLIHLKHLAMIDNFTD